MKQTTQSGFIIPVIIGILALGAGVGVWYSADRAQDGEVLSKIEEETAILSIAAQLGTSINSLSLSNSTNNYLRVRNKQSGKDLFVRRVAGVWNILEARGGYNSCEQLQATGFNDDFLYDCQTRYEKETIIELLIDAKPAAIVVGLLKKINTCKACVRITTDTGETVDFVLEEDFDDGDYVAVNIPDDEVVAINSVPKSDPEEVVDPEEEIFDTDEEESSDEAQDDTGNTQNDDADNNDGATIVEEIADTEEVADTEEEEGEISIDSPEEEEVINGEDPEEEERVDDEDNNDTVFDDDESVFSEDDEDIINFFDLDSSDNPVQVIGDPSEDRS